jgi:hypothetical protein
MLFDRRSWGVWKFVLAGWVGAIAILMAPRLVTAPVSAADAGTARILWLVVPAVFAMAWAVWMTTLAFRRLDEFQQEAGKFAWYWGGSIGIAASVVAYAFIGLGGMHWLDPAHYAIGKELFRAFQWGYFTGVGFPFAGFLIARLWWQAAKR